jgi:hypothetical protein
MNFFLVISLFHVTYFIQQIKEYCKFDVFNCYAHSYIRLDVTSLSTQIDKWILELKEST